MSSSEFKEKGEGCEDDGWREHNWDKYGDGWWRCDILKYFCFKFQGGVGEKLQLSDRRYRDDDLDTEKTRLLRSALQDATDVGVMRQEGKCTDAEIVAKILRDSNNPMPALEKMKFFSSDFESFRPFLDAAMARKLIELKALNLVRIQRGDSTPEGTLPRVEYLANVIGSGNLPNLAKLKVWDCKFEFKSLVASLKAIGGSLRELDLENSLIKTQDHLTLAEVMESGHLPHLELLSLWNTEMNSAISEAYSKGLTHLQALKILNFGGNWELQAPGHVALAEAMESGHLLALESLHLEGTNMDVAGCKAYAKALLSGHLPALKEIQFSYNRKLGDEGAKALSDAFASGNMSRLESIGLAGCNFGDVGMEAICRAMMAGHLRDLRKLDLSNSSWSEKGYVFLGSAIASGGLDSLHNLKLLRHSVAPNREKEIFLPILAAVSENKAFTAKVSWEANSDVEHQMEQFRERNLKHVQVMEDLGGPDRTIPVPLVPATHGKIYLCGNPEAGKTTLRKTLLRSLWKSLCTWERRPHGEDRTRGIAVSQLESGGKDGVSLALWDMAGQSEYHVVHHAFLRDLASLDAKSTFFIIVCKSQEEMKNVEDELNYWLQFIASSCRKDIQTPRSVFVVLNRNHGDSSILEGSKMNRWKVHLDHMKVNFKGYLNIYTEIPNKDTNRWKVHLSNLKVKLKGSLNIHTEIQNQNLFVMDIRRWKSVQALKQSLTGQSKSMITYIPEICHRIQNEVNVWKREMQFPALHWSEFLKKVQEIEPQWLEKTVDAATRCLNEAGLILYINKEFPADWQIPHTRLVILDPNWICAEVVGNIFVPENLKKLESREFKVNRYNGAVSIEELKDFFKTKNFEWQDSDLQDVVVILLWLGLCFKGREGDLFIPCRIEEDTKRGELWEAMNLRELHTDNQWVMGYSVEYQASEIGLAPIALWHTFQVTLAQTIEYNGGEIGHDFTVGKNFVSFKRRQMVVLIEVNVSNNNPTFSSIDIFVKPTDCVVETTKEGQVDLAHELVQILCKLWGEVCPGIGHVKRVVWPWPASLPKPDFTDPAVKDKCWVVSSIKMKVQEKGMGIAAESRVGPRGKITYDQLLCGEDIADVVRSLKGDLQKKVHAWNSQMEEGIKVGVFPADMLNREGFRQGTKGEASASWDFIRRENFKPIDGEQLESMTPTEQRTFEYLECIRQSVGQIQSVAVDSQRMIREVYKELNQVKMQQELTIEKLQNFQQLFLENEEQSCPRFIYLVTQNSGGSVVTTLKNAKSKISPTVKFHIRFLCEAPYDVAGTHGQHAVRDDLQEGIDVSTLKDWARKLAPWLKVSLAVLSISAKVAANVYAPGLGSIIPSVGDMVSCTLAELIVAGTGYSLSSLDKLMNEGQEPNCASSSNSPQELSGRTRKEMAKKLKKLSGPEFERKVGLSKVCLQQLGGSSSSVLWICSDCETKYRQSNKISRIFEL